MENEQGSLGDLLRNHGKTPDPAVWTRLESQLSNTRKRRGFVWWPIAVVLFLGIGGLTNYLAPDKLSFFSGKSDPMLDKQPVAHQEIEARPDHTHAGTEIKISTPEPETKVSGSQTEDGRSRGKEVVTFNSEIETMPSKSESLANPDSKIRNISVILSRGKSPKRRNNRKEMVVPVILPDGATDVTIAEIPAEIQAPSTRESGQGTMQARKNFMAADKHSVEQPDALEDVENQVIQALVLSQINSEETKGVSDAGIINQQTEAVRLDSVKALTRLDSVAAAEKSIPPDTILPKPEKLSNHLKFSILAQIKTSLVRNFELNRGSEESRIQLANDQGWSASRLSYAIGIDASQYWKWFGVYGYAGIGLLQDEVKVLTRNGVAGYDITTSQEEMEVRVIPQLDGQRILARSFVYTIAAGMILRPFGPQTELRIGGGASWAGSTLYRFYRSNGQITESKAGFSISESQPFLQVGASRFIPVRPNRSLRIEPMLQIFPKPVFSPSHSLRTTPVLVGVQLGYTW